MPNWTFNHLTVTGAPDALRKFEKAIAGDNGAVDFNRLRPMPEELANQESPAEVVATQAEADAKNEEWREAWHGRVARQKTRLVSEAEAKRRKEEYGAFDWYGWAFANWGTKWNACAVESYTDIDGLHYEFDTAWDTPRPLVEPISKLAADFGLTLSWQCNHEGGGPETII